MFKENRFGSLNWNQQLTRNVIHVHPAKIQISLRILIANNAKDFYMQTT